MVRLQKIIADAGLCSRREAERWIEAGRVTVNGLTAALGMSADSNRDKICVDGTPVADLDRNKGKLVYIMLNKPRGYLSAVSDKRGRKTVIDLLKLPSVDGETCSERVYPVGRLDLLSDGLLLLTNDGAAAHRLTHPSSETPKYYHVRVKGDIDRVERLSKPQTIDGVRYSGADVSVLDRDDNTALLSLTLHEGKNREIRKLCAANNLDVLRLTRVGEGNLRLNRLSPGKWRYVDKF